jgi:glucan phosphorylase
MPEAIEKWPVQMIESLFTENNRRYERNGDIGE